MKFLVTGSAGLVGIQVVNDLTNQNHAVYSGYHDSMPISGIPKKFDLLDKNKIEKTIQETKPDYIIHLAAMTDVDLCETNKDLAMRINAAATEHLARQAAKQDAFFLYVSTDYVFDGEVGLKKETDDTNPLGFYGKSKLEGEKAIENLASSWCIARTSTPFGVHPTKKSFPLFVAEKLRNKKTINVLMDQFTSPTYVPNLSKMLIEIAKRQITDIIHVSGATRISRYETAELVADKLSLDKKFLNPISLSDMNWKAKRPKDSSLDVTKASTILNEKPQPIDQTLEKFISEIKPSLLID